MADRSQGRPRNSETTDRLITAAAAQILENGFDSLNFEALAITAKTSRSAIYRRWPTKLDLGIAVIEQFAQVGSKPDTGSVVADLTEHGLQSTRNHDLVSNAQTPSAIWASIMSPALAGPYAERIGNQRRAHGREIIAAGVARGELPENVDDDLILDTLAGFVLFRNTFAPRVVDRLAVTKLVSSLCSSPPLRE